MTYHLCPANCPLHTGRTWTDTKLTFVTVTSNCKPHVEKSGDPDRPWAVVLPLLPSLKLTYPTWEEAVAAALIAAVYTINAPSYLEPELEPWRTYEYGDRSGCPCRPENGGTGICHCVLSGPKVRY